MNRALDNPAFLRLPHGRAASGIALGLLGLALAAGPAPLRAAEAADSSTAPAKITYDEHVRPIFREHCLSCHNQDAKKGDLALDSYAAMLRGGSSGEVVAAGNADGSRLWVLVNHADEPKMPPEQDKLPAAKLQTIKNWLIGGALENSGSVAKIKKATIDLGASAGAGKPAGAPIMPSGLWREPVVKAARPGAVTAMAASPWAPLIAIAGQKQVLLYNSDTAELLGVLPFPEGIPFVLKFNRSGALLLAGGGQGARAGRVVVFDVRDGKRVFEVGDELDAVLAADINESNSLIALGGPSKVVRIYSTADGAVAQEIRKHTDWIHAVEFSPDGVLLATADRAGGVFAWESRTGREFQNLAGHKGAVTDVSWRLDSNLLATGSEDGTIKLWEMENGSQVKSWNAHSGGVASVRFAPDGRLASTGRDKSVKLWDGNGAQTRAFEALGDIGLRVAVTHDSARVAGGDWLGDVRLWSTADGARVASLSTNPPTLAERAAAAAAELAAAAKRREETAAALAAAKAAVEEKTRALAAVNDASNAARAAVQKATADEQTAKAALAQKEAEEKSSSDRLAMAKTTAEAAGSNDPSLNQAVIDRQMELDKAAAEKQSLAASLPALIASVASAAKSVAAAEAPLAGLAAAKTAAEQAMAAPTAADKQAEESLAQAKAAHERIAAEKATYDAAHAAPQSASK